MEAIGVPSSGHYSGDMEDGVAQGKGVFTADDFSLRCTATWLDGKVAGHASVHYLEPHSGLQNRGDLASKIKIEDLGSKHKPYALSALGKVSSFEGRMIDNHANGEGKLTFESGAEFNGCFKDGFPEGHGRINFPDGDYCEGTYQEGEPKGLFQHFYSAENTLELSQVQNPEFVISAIRVDPPRIVYKTSQRPLHRQFVNNDAYVKALLKELEDCKQENEASKKKSKIVHRHSAFRVSQATSSKREAFPRTKKHY